MFPHIGPEMLQELLRLFNRKAPCATEERDESEATERVDLLKKLLWLVRGK
jgi:hypothetical protein